MRDVFGGNTFWRRQRVKLDKKEQERKMILEREKFFERTQKKKEREYEEKKDFYESKAAYMNEIYYAR